MKVIGLAGPPGSGKSAVGRALSARDGVVWIELDPLAWSVYRRGTEAFVRLVERFGPSIRGSSGDIDRAKLAKAAFASPEARRDLDAIVHPAVSDAVAKRIEEENAAGTQVLLVEGALLATSPHVDRNMFDAVFWLDVDREARRRRLRPAGREGQVDRLGDIEPGEEALRIPAEGGVDVVADRIWQAIEDL